MSALPGTPASTQVQTAEEKGLAIVTESDKRDEGFQDFTAEWMMMDRINQTDLIEHIDEEDKLGQPMVHLSVSRDWGVLDMFVLPWFRERTFPGQKGRLRTGLKVDTDHARYESVAEEHHVDFAVRYSHTIGDWDFGIYNFTGTSREPTLLADTNKNGRPILIPYYEQINQMGIDADSTELLAGLIQDVGSSARGVKLEASRRFGSNWRLTLEAWAFFDLPEEDLYHSLQDDDFIRLQLAYYF